MKGKLIILNGKNILRSILIVSVLIIMCISGSKLVNNVIETSMANRLLPIYSVDTAEKEVAITFDCAWSRSQ